MIPPSPPGGVYRQGGRHLDRRGHRALPFIERLAARVPVVIFAAPGRKSRRRGDGRQPVRLGGRRHHLIRDHGRRRLFWVHGPPIPRTPANGGLAWTTCSGPTAMPARRFLPGYYSVQSGEQAGEALLAMAGRTCLTRWCRPTTRWRSGPQGAGPAGVRVPQDVAVAGFDDIFPGSLCDPPLTTIHQPMRMLGERACARLLERIANPALPTTVELLATELVLRSSCGCPPAPSSASPCGARPAAPGAGRGLWVSGWRP